MSTRTAATDEQETKRVPTGAAMATTAVRRRCWSSEFPDDLLIVIYSMVASPRGRARFAAVCRSWCAAARGAPPVAPLPWLLLSPHDGSRLKRLHCPEDGTVVALSKPVGLGRWLVGGYDGGWLVSFTLASIRIANLFSGAEGMLAKKQTTIVCEGPAHGDVVAFKIVFSEPPTSDSCILAAMTLNCGVALCRLGCTDRGWMVQGCPSVKLVDITFSNGELYGLRYEGTLIKYDIGANEDGAPMIIAEHQLSHAKDLPHPSWDYHIDYADYIFDLQGKLAMASLRTWLPNLEPFFKVFKLIDICNGESDAHYKYKWMEVTSLGEHALFLGKKFSKAVHVPANMHGGVERNCIYCSRHCRSGPNDAVPSDKVFLTIPNYIGDHTYYKEDNMKKDVAGGGLKRIRSVGYLNKGGAFAGMWIIPPHI